LTDMPASGREHEPGLTGSEAVGDTRSWVLRVAVFLRLAVRCHGRE
jgi:hypothetical protein